MLTEFVCGKVDDGQPKEMDMSCRDCQGEGCTDYKTDFGAYVKAYRSTRDKPELREKVIEKARRLFLIDNSREKIARSDELPGPE